MASSCYVRLSVPLCLSCPRELSLTPAFAAQEESGRAGKADGSQRSWRGRSAMQCLFSSSPSACQYQSRVQSFPRSQGGALVCVHRRRRSGARSFSSLVVPAPKRRVSSLTTSSHPLTRLEGAAVGYIAPHKHHRPAPTPHDIDRAHRLHQLRRPFRPHCSLRHTPTA